jgi:outer membrane protein assembly factor BamB
MAANDGVLLIGYKATPDRGYMGYSPTAHSLAAYDTTTGRELWRDNTPTTGVSWSMSPLLTPQSASGSAYFLGISADPYVQHHLHCLVFCPGIAWLYAVNLHTGEAWWRITSGYADITHPIPF